MSRMDAGYNTMRQKGNPVPGGIIGPPYSRGYKYRDLALQVGGVESETVKYGHESSKTRKKE
jgi:hypothetical protein